MNIYRSIRLFLIMGSLIAAASCETLTDADSGALLELQTDRVTYSVNDLVTLTLRNTSKQSARVPDPAFCMLAVERLQDDAWETLAVPSSGVCLARWGALEPDELVTTQFSLDVGGLFLGGGEYRLVAMSPDQDPDGRVVSNTFLVL
jgi:hypothetical protein